MRMYDIILKKRNGGILTKEEIDFFVKGVTDESIEKYHTTALLMAIYFNGMSEEETLALTLAMASSGEIMDLSGIDGIKVDKHSTGGVGDKTTLSVMPIVAACGVKVAKMSGRGLGHTGGTVDKLESIPGFKTTVPPDEFLKNVEENGICIAGQSLNLAPADKEIYGLRDVTATVDIMPLIASSIMSKKLALGSDKIVLDVKIGSGAFMKTKEDAVKLARQMVKIGNSAGKETVALITDMDTPLGNTVGNQIEVIEAIDTLNGKGPDDFTELTYLLSEEILNLAGIDNAKEKIKEVIANGKALEKFAQMVKNQGGDEKVVFDTSLFEKPKYTHEIISNEDGFIFSMDAEKVGFSASLLGAGREKKGDSVDSLAGIRLLKKTGSEVKKGEKIAVMYSSDNKKFDEAEKMFYKSISFSSEKPEKKNVLIDKIS